MKAGKIAGFFYLSHELTPFPSLSSGAPPLQSGSSLKSAKGLIP
jgi:hypothetical protein